LLLRGTGPCPALAIARVHRDFMDAVHMQHDKLGMEGDRLRATLARVVSKLDT
jgi:hypothetical protein